MNNIEFYKEKIFDEIKHIDEFGNEYWEARELMTALEYSRWDAKISCEISNNNIEDHFPQVGKMVEIGSKTTRKNELLNTIIN